MKKKMTVADLIISYLQEIGVKYIFGIPGGALEPLYGSVYRNGKIKIKPAGNLEYAFPQSCHHAADKAKEDDAVYHLGPSGT